MKEKRGGALKASNLRALLYFLENCFKLKHYVKNFYFVIRQINQQNKWNNDNNKHFISKKCNKTRHKSKRAQTDCFCSI